MVCEKCGNMLYVRSARVVGNSVLRVRACMNCDNEIITVEKQTDDVDDANAMAICMERDYQEEHSGMHN